MATKIMVLSRYYALFYRLVLDIVNSRNIQFLCKFEQENISQFSFYCFVIPCFYWLIFEFSKNNKPKYKLPRIQLFSTYLKFYGNCNKLAFFEYLFLILYFELNEIYRNGFIPFNNQYSKFNIQQYSCLVKY